jgi:4-alpha-glucanotransferase
VNRLVGERRAGISVPLFSLRSSRSWGIGEIGDVPAAVDWLRVAHQSVLQILPLNELSPGESSPYSALSAMAIDPRYITVRDIEDAADFESLWADEIKWVREAPHIAYRQVTNLKRRALRACFGRFWQSEWRQGTARAEALRRYIVDEGWWLDDYGLYRALRARARERAWTAWEPGLRDRDPVRLAAARGQLARDVLFYQYVQWIAAGQWRAARRSAQGVEIFGDFPFMVTLDSADVWSRQNEFLLGASVGTPPDAFSPTGQDWGLPPYDWTQGWKNNFEWLRLRARRLADLYDGFRVDHLVGFYRTYIRPTDGSPAYFLPQSEQEQRTLGETVMAIVMSAGADVSVEDLGTVPSFVRASVARLGLPGFRVLRWEPGDPATYPAVSVAMTATHDTEPLAVWWESLTADERRRIAEMPGVSGAHPEGAAGLASPVFNAAIRDAVLSAMHHAGSNLVLLPIQDVFGWRDRINHPATIGDWNWTYVLPWPVDRMDEQAEAIEGAERLRELTDRSGRWGSRESADE